MLSGTPVPGKKSDLSLKIVLFRLVNTFVPPSFIFCLKFESKLEFRVEKLIDG